MNNLSAESLPMLSDRAQNYLNTLERRSVPTAPTEVSQILRSANLPTPDALIAFQQTYGGYTFHAGLEPLVATILFPRADFLRDQPWTVPDATEETGTIFFRCFETLYQGEFHLDANGTYYEDWDPVHEDFGHLVEAKALLAELPGSGEWIRVVDAHEAFADQSAFPAMGLHRDGTASCRFTSLWYDNNTVVQWRSGDVRAWKRNAGGR